MDRFSFPVNLIPEEEGGFVVTFLDFPEAITQGENIEESLLEARDCLAEALALRIDEKMEIPYPSSNNQTKYPVSPPLEIILKVLMYLSLKESNLTKKELANKLQLDEFTIQQLINPRENLQLSLLEKTLHLLGKEISINLSSIQN